VLLHTFEFVKDDTMKRLVFLFAGLALAIGLNAQNPNRKFISYKKHQHRYLIKVSDGLYHIQFYSPSIVETAFIPEGESYVDTSHAVIAPPVEINAMEMESKEEISIASKEIRIKIQKSPFQISYFDKRGLLISEKEGYRSDSLEALEFNLEAEELLFGGGARALGMDRRGHLLKLYNQAHYGYGNYSELLNYCMPIVISSRRYLLHFDNPATGFLDLDSKQDNSLSYLASSGRMCYQIVVGSDWENMIRNYTQLTGHQPMPPRWAMGNFASRFGYHSQREVMHTVEQFEKENIPLDAIILDLYWFGKEIQGTLGNFEFYRDSFPEPEQMMRTLQEKNIETILITEPFVLKTSSRWEEAVAKKVLATNAEGEPYTFDFYFGHGGIIDVYSEKGYSWFKDIYLKLFEMGMTGIWGDLGEPEMHPEDIIHANGSGAQVRNIYGHRWAELAKDAFTSYEPDSRPFVLMRAGYSGSQRHGIIPWSGDVNRGWDGLQSQVEIALQMGMQGLGYMHSDLGGFANPNLDDELYVRWLQYGVFQPIYRPHAQEEVPSEPVFRSDEAKALAKLAIEQRYLLLPYNYNLVFKNHRKGTPLMRPLFFEEPGNEKLYHCKDAYMWGDKLLVSPVTKAGMETMEVYLPASANWYNLYTGEYHKGGTTGTYQIQEDHIPVFVKAGSFLPTSPGLKSTKDYEGNELEIHYFPNEEDNDVEDVLYNDDGRTAGAFEKGMYEFIHMKVDQEGESLHFTFETEAGENWTPQEKQINVIVHSKKFNLGKVTVN
jgi:alpha-glucosidase (family GH31 glycosyl hydrolase)